MEIDVIKIIDKDAYLVRKSVLPTSGSFSINGEEVNNEMIRNGFVFCVNDVFEHVSSTKTLIGYDREGIKMSIEDYKSKPQYYGEDDTDEDVLHAIANKKELEGFKPCYADPKPERVDLNIIGYIEETGSLFITASIQTCYAKTPVIYTVHPGLVAMDEYKILSLQYADHAQFQEPDRGYLRFTKINRNFVFGDHKPFGDYDYCGQYVNLESATLAEKEARDAVKRIVNNAVFPEALPSYKAEQVLGQLIVVRDMKKKDEIIAGLSSVIGWLRNYTNCSE